MLTIREDFNGSSCSNVVLPFTPRPSAPASLQDHLKRASLRGIEAKDHVFAEGDPKSHIYQIVTGAVCLYKVLPDGRRQVIDFAYGGDFLSLSLGPVETYNAQATVATRVRCLSLSALSGLASRDPAIAMRICEAMSAELTAVRDHLVCVVQRSATERVVTFLLALSRRNNAHNRDCLTIELPMTRADIGDFLGLTIETVSRTFTKLRCRGLIEISQGTTIRLRDIGGLRAMADGTAGV
jgi:CRP-like cAMP-binding protein